MFIYSEVWRILSMCIHQTFFSTKQSMALTVRLGNHSLRTFGWSDRIYITWDWYHDNAPILASCAFRDIVSWFICFKSALILSSLEVTSLARSTSIWKYKTVKSSRSKEFRLKLFKVSSQHKRISMNHIKIRPLRWCWAINFH